VLERTRVRTSHPQTHYRTRNGYTHFRRTCGNQ